MGHLCEKGDHIQYSYLGAVKTGTVTWNSSDRATCNAHPDGTPENNREIGIDCTDEACKKIP